MPRNVRIFEADSPRAEDGAAGRHLNISTGYRAPGDACRGLSRRLAAVCEDARGALSKDAAPDARRGSWAGPGNQLTARRGRRGKGCIQRCAALSVLVHTGEAVRGSIRRAELRARPRTVQTRTARVRAPDASPAPIAGPLSALRRSGRGPVGATRRVSPGAPPPQDLPWALSATSTEEGPLRSHPAGDDSELGGEQQSPGEWVSPGSSPRSAGPSPDRRRRRAQALPRVGAGRGEEAHGDDLDDSHTPRLSGSPSTRPFTPPREGALTAALSTSQAAPSAPAARQLRGRSECWSPGPGPEAPASADMAAQRPTECRSSGPLTPRGGPDRAGPETQALTHDQAEAAAEAAMQFTLSQLSRSDSVPEWVPRFTQGEWCRGGVADRALCAGDEADRREPRDRRDCHCRPECRGCPACRGLAGPQGARAADTGPAEVGRGPGLVRSRNRGAGGSRERRRDSGDVRARGAGLRRPPPQGLSRPQRTSAGE